MYFLAYVYSEQLDLHVNDALDLLALANLYQYDKLKQDLSFFIERYMVVDNCCRIYQHAHHTEADELKRVCFEFVAKNYDVVRNTTDFTDLDSVLTTQVMDAARKRQEAQRAAPSSKSFPES